MSRIQILKDELTTDPLSRGYAAMTDQQAIDSLNALDRNAPTDKNIILQYMLLERYRTNSGADTKVNYLYGRLQMVCDANVGDDVFGSTTNILTQDQKASALTFIRLLGSDSGFALDLLDSRFTNMLTDIRNAEVFGPVDKNAIQAFSQNKQSRALELGIGRVRLGDVEFARSL